jgi:hypothetical protein
MGTYINNNGETVYIQQRDDGSYDVNVEGGAATTYGEDVVEHVYNDFDLHDVDLGEDGIYPEPDI